MAELSAGPHEVRGNDEQNLYNEREERARRMSILQRVEAAFDLMPFDAEAARIYGQISAATITIDGKPRPRVADLMIASTAVAEGLPLLTTNPGDFRGLVHLLRVVSVSRPPVLTSDRRLRTPHGRWRAGPQAWASCR